MGVHATGTRLPVPHRMSLHAHLPSHVRAGVSFRPVDFDPPSGPHAPPRPGQSGGVRAWAVKRKVSGPVKVWSGHLTVTKTIALKENFPIVQVPWLSKRREGREGGGGRLTSDVSARERAHMRHAYPLPRDIDVTWPPSTTISIEHERASGACHDDDCTPRLTLGSRVAARSQPSRSSSTPALFTSASSRLQSRLPLAFTATAQPCPHLTISRGRGSSLRASPLGPGSVAQAAVPVASPCPP